MTSPLSRSAIALFILTLPAMAAAQGGDHGPGHDDRGPLAMFERLDADQDGRVTMEEVEAERAGRFASVDTDGDGSVSRDEFIAEATERAAERAAAAFEALDVDGDGSLSADTLAARQGGGSGRAARMFARLDADGDGAVTREEAEAAMERFAEHRGEDRGRPGKGRH